MAKTIANVLVGVAQLLLRQPNDARAEWTTDQYQAGARSVSLYKGGSGGAGPTHVQFTPINTVTLQDFQDDITGVQDGFSFYHRETALTLANWAQFELRFECPTTQAWVEVTAVPLQNTNGELVWNQHILVQADNNGKGGQTPDGSSFFDWGLADDLSTILADIVTLMDAAEAGSGTTYAAAMVLTRVRIELWEAAPERTQYIDTVVIDGTAHPIEPGSVTPGLSLSSPFTEVGYTEDGVTIEYTADESDIEVEEETVPVDRVITKETIAITCNMAESAIWNIDKAIAGSVLVGTIIEIGGGVNKTMNLKILGTNPAGFGREILIPKATATGAVGMAYKKGEKTVVPVTFQALKTDSPACMIIDNAV